MEGARRGGELMGRKSRVLGAGVVRRIMDVARLREGGEGGRGGGGRRGVLLRLLLWGRGGLCLGRGGACLGLVEGLLPRDSMGRQGAGAAGEGGGGGLCGGG